jgi:hypothetical protein
VTCVGPRSRKIKQLSKAALKFWNLSKRLQCILRTVQWIGWSGMDRWMDFSSLRDSLAQSKNEKA